jgi:membrane-associated phospholipid phosphatase
LLLFEHTFKRFHSFLKIKILIFFIGVIFIGLFSLMIGLIQDFIANEFNQFNTITSMIIFYLFDDTWKTLMDKLNYLTVWKSLIVTGCITLIWIFTMGKNKLLEVQYYLIGIIGALLFGKGLNLLFGQITGNKLGNTFPSQQTFISIVIFVFFMYAIVRHCKKAWINMIVVTLTILLLVSVAAARVYLHLQAPSDVVAGYVFGGAWVSFIILIVEVSRLLNLIKLSLRK